MSMSGQSPQSPHGADAPDYTVLKIIVVGLGIFLVFGFLALIGAMAYKANHMASSPRRTNVGISAANGNGEVPEFQIPVPAGARIVDSQLVSHRLVVRLETPRPDGASEDQILIIDADTGLVESKLRFLPE